VLGQLGFDSEGILARAQALLDSRT